MVLQIITGLSGAAVVVSLLFLARQTRELARQTRLNNHIGTLAGMHDTLEILHAIQSVFTDKPELRAYFYEGKKFPSRGKQRAVVLNLAELLADAIDYGLMVVDLMPGTVEYEGWHDYALFMMQSSPAIRDLIHNHSGWYLTYSRLVSETGSSVGQ